MRPAFRRATVCTLLSLLFTVPSASAQQPEPVPPAPPSFPEAPPSGSDPPAADVTTTVPVTAKRPAAPASRTVPRSPAVAPSTPAVVPVAPPADVPVSVPAPAGSAGVQPIDALNLPSVEHRALVPSWWPVAAVGAAVLLALYLVLSVARARGLRPATRGTARRTAMGPRSRPTLTPIGAVAVALALLAAGLALGRASAAPGDLITTFAGGGIGPTSYDGDGSQATQARLLGPAGVATAPNGDVFIADTVNHRIRRVSPTGVITTFAGTGTRGVVDRNQQPDLNIGDSGPAVDAHLNFPTGITVAANGDVYFADSGNRRVRRVGADGNITTVFGATSNDIDTSDTEREATRIGLGYPTGIAINGNGGVLFVSDADYSNVFKVNLSLAPPTASRYAGDPQVPRCSTFGCSTGQDAYSGDGLQAKDARLNGPRGLAVDAAGNLFIADTNNHRIRKVDTTGVITTVAGNGAPTYAGDGQPAIAASLSKPAGVTVAGTGASQRLVIADTDNHRIREVRPDGVTDVISTLAGDGTAGFAGDGGAGPAAKLSSPAGVSVVGTKMLIADPGNNRVRLLAPPAPTTVSAPGAPSDVAATAGNASATVSWTAPVSDGGSPLTSYTVTPYVGTTAQPATTVTGNPPPLTATVNGLANGTTYTFTVTATNAAGSSPPSSPSNAVTPAAPAATAPGAPTDVTAVAGNASATVSWAAPASDGGSALTSYAVTPYVGTSPQPETAVGGSPPPTSTTIGGLTNGTTYTFTVRAVNAVGAGPASTPSNAVTPAGTPPGAPTGVTATAGDASATVSWTAPASDGGSPLSSYTVTPYLGTTPRPATTVTGSPPATTATVSGLTNDFNYTFRITATNAVGTGPASAPSNMVTPAAPPPRTAPGAPTKVGATAGDGSAEVAWIAPEADGNSPITSYSVTPYVGTTARASTQVPGSPPPTSTTVTGLTNGTTYTFRVKATNGVGSGPASQPSNAVTPAPSPVDRPTGDDPPAGEPRPPAPASDAAPACPRLGPARADQVVYPSGFSLIGLPGGTRVPTSTKLWGWFDQGRGSNYSAGNPNHPVTAGRGYWKYFGCPTVVDLAQQGSPVTAALGAYHASMVGNPLDGPATVTGHDFASRWVPAPGGGGSYRLSGFREPQPLAPGEAIWVFSYRATTIRIGR